MESAAEYTTTVSTPFEDPFVVSGDVTVCEREKGTLKREENERVVRRNM
jgi:hypothetical protein